jgi:hypothetical protein
MAKACDEQDIPALWAPLHRYDATLGYEAARDGLLVGLELQKQETASLSPQPPSALPAYAPSTPETSSYEAETIEADTTPPISISPKAYTPSTPAESKPGFWGRLFGQGNEAHSTR